MVRVEALKIWEENKSLVDISFNINKSTALVGESGSGKSLTLKALLRMLPSNLKAKIKTKSSFKFIKGKTVSLVPQNPFTSLSPMTRIKKQFLSSSQKVQKLFELVELEAKLINNYPPNLSGGQLQRVIFAMALENNPKLILLDEPTTALDYKLKNEMIEVLKTLQAKLNFLMLFVTHEINLASKLCEYMVVLRDGRVVEEGVTKDILNNPKTAYTKALIKSSFANREFRK